MLGSIEDRSIRAAEATLAKQSRSQSRLARARVHGGRAAGTPLEELTLAGNMSIASGVMAAIGGPDALKDQDQDQDQDQVVGLEPTAGGSTYSGSPDKDGGRRLRGAGTSSEEQTRSVFLSAEHVLRIIHAHSFVHYNGGSSLHSEEAWQAVVDWCLPIPVSLLEADVLCMAVGALLSEHKVLVVAG